MPAAEIIAIGTELLLGEIQDTNTRYLARILRDAGIDLFRTHIIGDNAERIAQAIRESLTRCQIVVTTGGLGPTVDDPTRQAVALAMGMPLEFREDLWAQILERFKRFNRTPTENNRRQAFIPQNSIPVENPVGTAPAFFYETQDKVIISLPGVPREMEFLVEHNVMPYLRDRYALQGTIKACVLHTAGVGESPVDEWVADLETSSNPTVGLLAHSGVIDIRVTAKASSIREADQMIAEFTQVIQQRLGHHIYGRDEQTLENVIADNLKQTSHRLFVFEYGLETDISNRLARIKSDWIIFQQLPERLNPEELAAKLIQIPPDENVLKFACSFFPGALQQTIHLTISTAQGLASSTRTYGGPPGNGPLWATNTALDYIRRKIQKF